MNKEKKNEKEVKKTIEQRNEFNQKVEDYHIRINEIIVDSLGRGISPREIVSILEFEKSKLIFAIITQSQELDKVIKQSQAVKQNPANVGIS